MWQSKAICRTCSKLAVMWSNRGKAVAEKGKVKEGGVQVATFTKI